MLHFEVELEVAYELSSRLHYLPDFVFFSTWYVIYNKKQPYIPSRAGMIILSANERAQSLFMSIEISDTYIYIYLFICCRTSTSTRMPGKSLLRNGLSN